MNIEFDPGVGPEWLAKVAEDGRMMLSERAAKSVIAYIRDRQDHSGRTLDEIQELLTTAGFPLIEEEK